MQFLLPFLTASTVLAQKLPQELIKNGGFEDQADNVCKKDWCGPDDTANDKMDLLGIKPWYLSSDPASAKFYELDSSKIWPPFGGKWSMDLSSDSALTIMQAIATTPGTKYLLTFRLNANRYCGTTSPLIKTGYSSAASSVQRFSFDSNLFDQNQWMKIQMNFTAFERTTIVNLGSTTSGSCGPVVDHISVKEMQKCPV